MGDLVDFERRLIAAGFAGALETDAAAGVVYGTDNSIYQLRPVGVAVPTSIDDLSAIARANCELDQPFDLVARGGGTGTNGQSLTNGLVVDTRRSMNRIVSIDAEARTAIVQPGVVLGELNAALSPYGLFFAPHVSTASRATIGGMVAADAAGKGSLVHGRTNDHVLAVTAVLDDGTPWTFERLDADELESVMDRQDRIGELHRRVHASASGVSSSSFPDIPRGFTGYNLLDAVSDDALDLTKIIAGSEGTLALVGEITIRLTPTPSDPRLAVLTYQTFDDAIREANRLKATNPSAIECLDERTLSLARSSPAFSRVIELLGEAGLGSRSMLILEFDGARGVAELLELIPAGESPAAFVTTADPSEIAAVWKMRADAVGLLGQAVGGRRSVPFVEDCAVPPHRLEEFVAAFRDVLDGHGLTYGMFGHADVGCVHVRPALDLYDQRHEQLIRSISNEVAALVRRFSGVLWGEHGRGFRGEFLDLSDDVVQRMRDVKTAFDPRNVLNPGKLYAPLDTDVEIVRIDAVPLRVHRDRTVTDEQRRHFDSAFACNGNGICHHWGPAEVMCPSFKVTLDPRLSPKGRADLLRGWLARPDDAQLADDVADSMRQCLSCSACTGRCPVQVDIPELKSRFFEVNPDTDRRRRVRNTLLSRFESWLPVAQRVAPIARGAQRLVAPALRRALGLVDLPGVPSGSLRSRMASLDVPVMSRGGDRLPDDATVVIVPDAFTAFLDPEVLAATIAVMRAMGERPVLAPFVSSGKFDHVVGRRQRFAKAVARRRTLFEHLSASELPLVVIEPAVDLLGGHEYAAIDPSFPDDAVTGLAAFMAPRVGNLPARTDGGTVELLGHCTEVSLASIRMDWYRAVLERVGCDVSIEQTTCCGMAGVFGHEVENSEMSTRLFETGWRPTLESNSHDHRCASGYSCRSQAARFGHELVHPIEVVASALARSDVAGQMVPGTK